MNRGIGVVKNALYNAYKDTVERVTPTPTASKFEEKRILTPAEFVKAGDYLVRAFPSWAWAGGEVRKRKAYLPDDKQYLITRRVPSVTRAAEFGAVAEVGGGDDSEEWATVGTAGSAQHTAADKREEGDDVVDIGDEPEDEVLPASSASTRKYDLYISYDKYYQVPRFWLVGYDEAGQPLTADQIYEDVSPVHARNTITWDEHPNERMRAASVHPCRHGEVMKKLGDVMQAGGKEFTVDHYLVIFLKFVASVMPTIEYDYTMAGGL